MKMGNASIHLADAVQWAKEYTGLPFHALLCDAPYHLTSIVKRFGDDDSAPAKFGTDGVFSRSSKGFMGKQWDGGDLSFNPETWKVFKSIMYPGAFGMAFASSRGWHRQACAIEDAGFVIHPSIFGWAYGSGFPKATRVKENTEFSGHRYGLQALKPALEPIIVFQKPYEGKPIDNITATGAGVLNVDGGRIGTSDKWTRKERDADSVVMITDSARDSDGRSNIMYRHKTASEMSPQGRWPANFYLDAEAARRLDEQSGNNRGAFAPVKRGHNGDSNGIYGDFASKGDDGETFYSDSGGASRFFFRVEEQIDDADPVRYVAKASRRERDAGMDGMPIKAKEGNRPNSPDETGKFPDHDHRENGRNPHPTVKPLVLTRYLATLLLPPAEYAPRRLFVPFAGVASECIGAIQAGWDEVVGIEITDEYVPIARARIEYWKEKQDA